MAYRSLSRADARAIRSELLAGQAVDVAGYGELCGTEPLVDLTGVADLAARAAAEIAEGRNREEAEHAYSGELYLALRGVSVEVRDDPGFWRWVTLTALLPFTSVREKSLGLEALGAGSNSPDILACRMFLRGQCCRAPQPNGDLEFSLAHLAGTQTHDLWQSHILRRTTGAERPLAHALLRQQSMPSTKMKDQLRPFVRECVNRKKLTMATFLMDDAEADTFLQQERLAWQGGPGTEDDDAADGLDDTSYDEDDD